MTKKIFRSICSVAVCITLAVLAIILGVLYNYYSDIQRQRLDTQAEYVASAVEIDGKEYLFPAVDEFIVSTDTDNKIIRVKVIEGMFSEN